MRPGTWLVVASSVLGALTPGKSLAGICKWDVCLRFEPSESVVELGETFTVDIVADINSPVLGWGLDLTIVNPAVASLTASPSIGPDWFAVFAPDGDGLAGLAFPDGIAGEGIVLATLSLHADSDGETDLVLSVSEADPNEGFALDPTGFAEWAFQSGRIVVPEPATIALMLIGAASLSRLRRSTRARRMSA